MKSVVFCFFAGFSLSCFASDQSSINPVDNTRSVLSTQTASETAPSVLTAQPAISECLGNCSVPTYTGRKNIPPCAVGKRACLSYCEKTTDACCNVTAKNVAVEVPICAPACPTKDSVTRSRDGKRAVYDYGRYEVVVKANDDGDINVRYRKRILDR